MISHSLRAVNVQCDYGNGVVVDTANPDSEYGATLFPRRSPANPRRRRDHVRARPQMRHRVSLAPLLGGGKGCGRGAEGVSPSHREEGDGHHGKGFGAEPITYWPAGEATEEGKGD